MLQAKTILHVIDTTGPGGAETIFTQLAAESIKRGFNAVALIRGPGWVSRELERLGIETIIINCKGSFNISFLWNLIKIIKKRKIAIIQSHLLGSNVYASLAGLICGVPVISTFHGFVDISKRERFIYAKFLVINYGSCKVICVTNQIKEMLNKRIRDRKLLVIANGIDVNKFFYKPINEIGSPIKLCALGNVRMAKNYSLAIHCLAELIKRGIDVELTIAGDDKNKLADAHKKEAETLGVDKNISWLGFCDDPVAYLHSQDIFILTSSSEGHPLALTQAMSVGLPIVVTRCGVEGIVEDGVSALVAKNGDWADFCEKILMIINDRELANRLRNKARQSAVENWSMEKSFNQYFDIYKCLL